MSRPRVTALLDSLTGRRLVAVVGDAASGRSTTVRDWADGRDDVVVTAVPAGRDSPRDLLELLVAATGPRCPGLRDVLGPELDASATARVDDSADLAAVLAGSLAAGWADRAADPFVLVLDDLDHVTDPAGRTFVADLVRLHPRSVRLVVVARTPPAFGHHRLAAAGEYGELGPRALRFTDDETTALFAAAGLALDADQAREVTAACGGWAGGLRLAVETALAHGVDAVLDRLGRSTAPSVLAGAAVDPLDDASRAAVRALAVLGVLEKPVAAPDAAVLLDALAERGLLVHDDGTAWALTALAEQAVVTTMPVDPDEAAAVLADHVDLALTAGAAEPALRWATRHGDADLVRTTLARVGPALFDAGSPLLTDAAARLPVPVGDPALDGLLASHFAARGDLARALAHLGTAAALPASTAWRVASALWMHGDATAAQDVLDRGDGAGGDAADEAQLAGVRATLAWARGEGTAAREHADEALRLARASGDEAALGSAWVVQALVAALEGDLGRNQRCYSTALPHAVAARDVLTQLRIHCNVGSRLTETGLYREAVVELDEAVRLGEATGQRSRIALARLNQGQARLGLGQLDEALLDIDAALGLWQELSSPMAAYAQQARGEALARRGDVTRAAGSFRAAIAAAEEQQDAQTLAPSLAGLARCRVLDDPDDAVALADRALAVPVAVGGTVAAQLARGWVAVLAGDHDLAASLARDARDEAARREDPSSLAQALVLGVLASPEAGDGRLDEARALVEEVGDAIALAELDVVVGSLRGDRAAESRGRAALRALGVRDSAASVAGPLAVLRERRDAAVTIRTLGSFAVLVGDAPVPASAWQSRKARDLVKILASRRGRSITRGALAELLWPDADGDASGNRLSVALSTARAVLDPGRRHPQDRFLSADRDSVRLDLRAVSLDLEDWLAAADEALAVAGEGGDAVALLTAAAAGYGGDFCEEDPYEAWASQPRDEFRARRQQVVRTLAETLVRAGRPDDAVPWWIALLGSDPYDEASHLDLIRTLVRAGRHGEARRSYRAYTDRMAEIDVEPAAFPQRPRR